MGMTGLADPSFVLARSLPAPQIAHKTALAWAVLPALRRPCPLPMRIRNGNDPFAVTALDQSGRAAMVRRPLCVSESLNPCVNS